MQFKLSQSKRVVSEKHICRFKHTIDAYSLSSLDGERTARPVFVWWATAIALLASVAGTMASFSDALGRVGTGAVIVLAAAACFAFSLVAARE